MDFIEVKDEYYAAMRRGQKEQKELMHTLDQTVQALLELGVTREALLAHLLQGGNENA